MSTVNRRSFLGLSSAALAAFALDPERLLWVPGAKTILIPAPSLDRYFRTAHGRHGQLVRGSRISAHEYNRLVGIDIVWHDAGSRTVVQFPSVDMGKRGLRGVSMTVPPNTVYVVSLGMGVLSG